MPAPPSPRSPRLSTILHKRWMLGLFGALALLTLLTINITYLAFGSDLTSFADEALDAGSTSVTGTVMQVEQTSLIMGSRPWLRVHFEFLDLTGERHAGRSLLRETDYTTGSRCRVEFLASDPSTNRLTKTSRQIEAPLLDLVLRWVLLPGMLLFLVWLQGVTRLRSLLRDGLSTTATITGLRPYAWISPPQMRVDYRFRDHDGGEHRSWHWVAKRSALGRQLLEEKLEHPEVLFDEKQPAHSRLVGPNSFRI